MAATRSHIRYLLISSLVLMYINKVYSMSFINPAIQLLHYFMPTSRHRHQCERHRKNTVYLPGMISLYLIKLISNLKLM